MNTQEERATRQRISEWFLEDGQYRAPDTLLEGVFARTAHDRRRWRVSGLLDRIPSVWRRVLVLVAVGTVGIVLISVTGLPGGGWWASVTGSSPAATALVASPDTHLAVVDRFVVCSGAVDLAVTDRSLWVACPAGLVRIDPLDGSADAPRPGVGAVSVGPAGSWATADGGVAPLDPASGVVGDVVATGNVSKVAVTDDSVWVIDPLTTRLTRVDGATSRIAGQVGAGTRPVDLVAGLGSLWLLDQGAGVVRRLDPSDGSELARIPASTTAVRLVVGGGFVWVVDPGTGYLLRIDPSNDLATALPVTPSDRDALTTVAATEQALYATDRRAVAVLDPANGTRSSAQQLTGYPVDVAILGGDPWVLAEDSSLTHLKLEGG
jgi:hypothetical protein